MRSIERDEIKKMKKKFREELATARAEVRRITESLQRQRTWTHAQEAQRLLHQAETTINRHTASEPVPVASLEEGDVVEIANLDTLGRLLEKPEGKKSVRVQVGSSELSVHVDRLVGVGKAGSVPDVVPKEKSSTPRLTKPSSLSSGSAGSGPVSSDFAGIDLRGQTAEEALEQLTAQLDQALLRNAKSVRIIHGHGTGKLKTAIREFLAQSVYVEEYRPGSQEEGGDGVTMAELT